MKQTCIFFLLLLSMLVQAEEKKVFVTVDKNNNLVFSDNPTPGSTELNVKQNNNIMLPVTTSQGQVSKPKVPVYEVAIAKPLDQETLRENNGTFEAVNQVGSVLRLVDDTFKDGTRYQWGSASDAASRFKVSAKSADIVTYQPSSVAPHSQLIYAFNGRWCHIQAVESKQYFDVNAGACGDDVCLWQPDGSATQLWRFEQQRW